MAGEINPENLSWHHAGQDGNVIHAGIYYERFYIRAEVTYTRHHINDSLVESKNLQQMPVPVLCVPAVLPCYLCVRIVVAWID